MIDFQHIGALAESADRQLHAAQAQAMSGLSQTALTSAALDWLVHLANSPGKQTELMANATAKSLGFMMHVLPMMLGQEKDPFIKPLPQDRRFSSEEWQKYPFNVISQSFLMVEQWWHYATTGIRGVTKHNESVTSFTARQMLDMFSPTNFPLTNPDILKATMAQGGANIARGLNNWIEDQKRQVAGGKESPSKDFVVGKNIAATPGKVVFRNRLIELIQYSPTTETVYADPVLIVPAWIMKYYILDLSQHNSLVKFLVDRGHTVFMISWHNPGPQDRDMGMDDYVRMGTLDAINTVSTIIPDRKIHMTGYCIGGTLSVITAATLARDNDHRLGSLTLFTTQTDFTEAGELMLFIDEEQVTLLEDMMWASGVLDTKQMAGAFQLLRSNDLLWSMMVRRYMLGEDEAASDLMAWNKDATRMPYRMHSEYLRRMFLNNDLAGGRYKVFDRPIAVTDIRVPIFSVATDKDHVAPWKSVYKLQLFSDTDITFVLTGGGHNAGIVSEPDHPGRRYQISDFKATDKHIAPQDWQERTPFQKGSWWLPWEEWLVKHNGEKIAPPAMGAPDKGIVPVCDAPGTYVREL